MERQESLGSMSRLPRKILHRICSFVDHQSALQLLLVSSYFYGLCVNKAYEYVKLDQEQHFESLLDLVNRVMDGDCE